MSTRHSRAGTLQKQRLIQIGTAAACVAFVGMALGAVVIDRTVAPAEKPTPPALAPAAGTTDETSEFQPMPKLIASGLSSVYELDAVETPAGPTQGEGPVQPPPQDVVLVAAIGQPGSMMAVIREGASQTAMAEGQRAGTVEVLEVRPGWARVKHNGQEKELTVGKPILMVSDMGGGGAAPMSSQIITQPGADTYLETAEEGGITRTGGPTTFSRATSGGANPRGPGTPGGRRGGANPGGGNQGGGANGNGVGGGGNGNQANGNGNGQPAAQGGQKRQEEDR
jgi:hypothetical protein